MKAIWCGLLVVVAIMAVYLGWQENRGREAQREPVSPTPPLPVAALPRESNADLPPERIGDLDRISPEPTRDPGSTAPKPVASRVGVPPAAAPAPLPVISTSFTPTFSATPYLHELPIEIEIRDIMTRRSRSVGDTERVSEFVDILLQSALIANNSFPIRARYTHAFFMDGMYWHYNAKTGEVGRIYNQGHTGTYLIPEGLRPRFQALVTGEDAAPPNAKTEAAR